MFGFLWIGPFWFIFWTFLICCILRLMLYFHIIFSDVYISHICFSQLFSRALHSHSFSEGFQVRLSLNYALLFTLSSRRALSWDPWKGFLYTNSLGFSTFTRKHGRLGIWSASLDIVGTFYCFLADGSKKYNRWIKDK